MRLTWRGYSNDVVIIRMYPGTRVVTTVGYNRAFYTRITYFLLVLLRTDGYAMFTSDSDTPEAQYYNDNNAISM